MPKPDMRQPLPSFYDNLDETLVHAWHMIGRGAVDRRAAMHTPAVATIGIDGRPEVRTVVLRGVNSQARTLRFHTDARSAKVAGFARDARIGVLAYDAAHKLQLRFNGLARLHTGDDVSRDAWQRSQVMSRVCYQQARAPGAALGNPDLVLEAAVEGFDNFSVVEVHITEIEWLYLATQGHRRARFTWVDGLLTATWLAP